MHLHQFLVRLATLQAVISTVAAITPWNVSSYDFARAWWQSSVIIDNWLYLEGGEYYLAEDSGSRNAQFLVNLPSGNPLSLYHQSNHTYYKLAPTLSIDLSTSWNTSSVVVHQISKPLEIFGKASYRRPGLFRQNSTNSVVVYSGDDYSGNSSFEKPYTIWRFTPSTPADGDGIWGPTIGRLDNIVWPHHPTIADTPSGGFVVGGYSYTPKTSNVLRNMTIVGKRNTYTGSPNIGPFSAKGLKKGSAHFVPNFGTGEGMIIYIGGANMDGTPFPMSLIHMYDIASKEWYSQPATGDIPKDRVASCVTGGQDFKTNSYEIFLYGGSLDDYFNTENSDSRRVYILTLPAFRWIRTPDETQAARAGNTCEMVKNQIISYGGWDPSTGSATYARDPWKYGLGIFDTTKLTWSENYNSSSSEYIRSELVSNSYLTNPQYPTWSDKSLSALFSKAAAVTLPSSPITQPTSQPTNSTRPSKTPVAPIVGGTIGGVALLAGVGIMVWIYIVRPRRARKLAPTTDEQLLKPELHAMSHLTELGTSQTHEMPTNDKIEAELSSNDHQPPVELDASYARDTARR